MRGRTMVITKAVQRLGWRFSEAVKKNNTFTINQNDIDAIKSIANYVEQTQAQQFQDNELFAKMYILAYAKMIEHFKADILDNEPRKQMGRLLNRPLNEVIEDFRQRLNDSDKYNLIEAIQSEIKHPATVNDLERIENTKKIKEALKTPENESRLIKDAWDFETVQENLISEVNNILNIHRHG